MKRKFFSFRGGQPPLPPLSYDAERGIFYLKRVFEAKPQVVVPSLSVLLKTVGEESYRLVEALIASIGNKAKKNKIIAEFEKAFDEDDVATVLYKLYMSSSGSMKKNLINEIMNFLDVRCKVLFGDNEFPFSDSVEALGGMLHLTLAEKALCDFLYTLEGNFALRDYFFDWLKCHKVANRNILAVALGISRDELEEVFLGSLFRLGLLTIDQDGIDMSDEFKQIFENPSKRVLRDHLEPVGYEPVPLDAHLINKDTLRHVMKLLEKKQEFPVNILFYGPPGTGKSSFARALVNALKVPGYVVSIRPNSDSLNRRVSIAICLTAMNKGDGAIVIVDEADGILNTEYDFFFLFKQSAGKGWLNYIMDTPGVRIIWITNCIEGIHDSVRRRFNFSIPFRPFNREQRKLMWYSVLKKNGAAGLLGDREIETMSSKFSVTTGPIDTAVKSALAVGHDNSEEFAKAIEMGLSAYVTVENGGWPTLHNMSVQERFIIEGLSVEGNLSLVLSHMEKANAYLQIHPDDVVSATALFYGPPGAGKTEFARYIAEKLGRELMVVSAPEILDMYVGQTEKNIRSIFSRASHENVVLVIDEVDSFLFSRNKAVRSWELGMVNEFLRCMERFRGIFIATTNRLEDLDKASLRRFHHKVGFGYLSPRGKRIFYDRFLAPLVKRSMDRIDMKELESIPDLTPGDFKSVFERYRFTDRSLEHRELLEALRGESEVKKRHGSLKNPAGFVRF